MIDEAKRQEAAELKKAQRKAAADLKKAQHKEYVEANKARRKAVAELKKAKLKEADLKGYKRGYAAALSERDDMSTEEILAMSKRRTDPTVDPYTKAFDKGYRRGWSDGATLYNERAEERYRAEEEKELEG
jgi:hypothetical protein